MVDIINNLYNVALFSFVGCVATMVVTVVYIVEIIKYERKCTLLNEELEKIKINDMLKK